MKRSRVKGPLGSSYFYILILKSSYLSRSSPVGLLSRENDDFYIFWTCPFSKNMHCLKFEHLGKNGSPGQTTMLTRRVAKFCVEPRSPFSNISHHDPKASRKLLTIVPWPECRPEFPGDGDGGGNGSGVQRTVAIGRGPYSIVPRHKKSLSGSPRSFGNCQGSPEASLVVKAVQKL